MLTLKVYNQNGEATGEVSVDEAEFGGKINKQLMHEVVLMYLANQRAGTHSTLRRGEVAGSTKKLFRQKGTGNARVGTRRTNKRRGGGTAKGPKPRDYEYHLPKKAVRAATRMAVLSKLQDQEVIVLDDLKLDGRKTKEVAAVLKAVQEKVLSLDPKARKKATWLIGTAGLDSTLYRCARNIAGVKVLPVHEFNCYQVLRPKRLLLTWSSLEALRKGPQQTAAEPQPTAS